MKGKAKRIPGFHETKVIPPELTAEDRAEQEYQRWKDGVEDYLILEEEEWERVGDVLSRVFYHVPVEDPGIDAAEGVYRVKVLDEQVTGVTIGWGVEE